MNSTGRLVNFPTFGPKSCHVCAGLPYTREATPILKNSATCATELRTKPKLLRICLPENFSRPNFCSVGFGFPYRNFSLGMEIEILILWVMRSSVR